MTETATQESEIDRMRAFELRMQTEGAAGFANGLEPWNEWQPPEKPEGARDWGCGLQQQNNGNGKTLCEKLLSAMAALSVATLAVGIGGVYLSAQNQTVTMISATQPEPIESQVATAAPADTAGSLIRRTLPAQITEKNPAAQSDTPALGEQDAVKLIAGLEPPGTRLLTPAANRPEQPPVDNPRSATPVATADIPDTLPAPAAGVPTTDAPVTLAKATPPLPATDIAKAGEGRWVVNIASYRYESMAQKKLAVFKKKGVAAEIFPIELNGKPMYRIRATGYESRKEANTWVSLLEDRLELDGAWVSKR